ncbi:MAG: phenylacetate--CoA ligase family protein [Candidatus Brennerbacteria bacterium]|nr:phenylacetate--CoA ligase family protein [Candidatus Brennerbacteria bacterium]
MVSNQSQLSAEKILRLIKNKNSDFWVHLKERQVLRLFHLAAVKVPAYGDFLKKNRIQPDKIKTFQDFQSVPFTSKNNYLRKYLLEKLTWDGSLKRPQVFTATSGSTSEPFYFSRDNRLDWESSIAHELFLRNDPDAGKEPTLVIVAFGMGVWIGGLITYKAFELASYRGYPLSILTPGINKIEIFNALKKLAPHFKKVILAGYPPFLKDILDEAANNGVNLKKFNLRLIFAAESFTEKFRDYVINKAGIKNFYLDTMNIYGTADIGTMAYETPAAILIRRLIVPKKNLFRSFFSDAGKTPTLCQYNPFFINFEAPNGDIILTGNNTVPLIRYSIGDRGGVFNFDEAMEKFKQNGVNFKKEAVAASLTRHIYRLPFVYVYERSDFSTTLYGLQIFPEIIKETLLDKKLAEFLTGKFTLLTKYDSHQNQYLEINLEFRKNKEVGIYLKKYALSKIIANLRIKSSEFRELHNYLKNRAVPRLVFWPYEYDVYFKPGIKQKWVKKI